MVRENSARYVRVLREIVLEAKSRPCADCGQTFPPFVMDFDHLDAKQKRDTISQMVRKTHSIDVVLQEIAKCEVGCANCHRVRTFRRLGRTDVAAAEWAG